jgi:hemolysin D
MIEQASAQQNNITGLDQQVAKKIAEADEIEAAIAKLQASLPFLIGVRKAMVIEFDNKIAHSR